MKNEMESYSIYLFLAKLCPVLGRMFFFLMQSSSEISEPLVLQLCFDQNFAHDKKSGSVGSFQLNKGTNRFCLAQAGVYQLTPDSCHKFEQEIYTYDT